MGVGNRSVFTSLAQTVDVIKVAVIPQGDRVSGPLLAVFNPNRPTDRDQR